MGVYVGEGGGGDRREENCCTCELTLFSLNVRVGYMNNLVFIKIQIYVEPFGMSFLRIKII